MRARKTWLVIITAMLLNGCGTPPFELFGRGTSNVPSGPKVTDLVRHLRCELKKATLNSKLIKIDDQKAINLQAWFGEIKYVATAAFTLEVTNTQTFSPSLSNIYPYSVPMTNVTLSVSGQLMDQQDRSMLFNTSVDFESLDDIPEETCKDNHGLEGDLELGEILSMGLAASSANSVGVLQSPEIDDKTLNPYAFGVFGTLMNFTITEGIGGGPNWALVHFKGPSGGQNPLLNTNRVVKDTLNISFVPACLSKGEAPQGLPGYPAWTSKLKACKPMRGPGLPIPQEPKAPALNSGVINNTTQYLQRVLPLLGQ